MAIHLRYKLVRWQYAFMKLWLNVLRKILYKPIGDTAIQRILIVRKGTLGDCITIMPVVHALKQKYPSATCYLLTEHYGAPEIGAAAVFEEGLFSEIITASEYSPSALSVKLEEMKPDVVIELPQPLDNLYTQTRNMLYFRWMCGIKKGAGWQVSTTTLFRKTQLKYRVFKNETERHFQQLHSHGVALNNRWEYPLIKPTALDKLTAVGELMTFDDRPIAAIAIGAKHERKRWPVERFVSIADRLVENGWQVCWIGNTSDSDQLPVNHAGENVCGKLSIAETVALFKHISLLIGNDSGPMHLAYACHVPVVSIFSLRDYPGKWYPPAHTRHIVLSDKEVPCAICWDKPCSDSICMKNISVNAVWSAIQQLVKNE